MDNDTMPRCERSETMASETYTFQFHFEREPDTGWTMRLNGTVKASTLEDAWCEVSASLGHNLWTSASHNLADDWRVSVVQAGIAHAIYECEFCEGTGCSSCETRGFKFE